MTREEAIRQLKRQMTTGPIASIEAIRMATSALQQEKEPAPSANDASSKQNHSKENDSTEKAKCQERIKVAIDILNNIYTNMDCEEQNVWDLGITYKCMLDVQRIVGEDEHDRH